MAAAKYKLYIEQGTNYRKPFVWKAAGVPVVLTGWTARMQIRESIDSEEFVLELTTENGGIVIDGAAGKFTLVFKPSDTTGKTWRTGVFDIELIDPTGQVRRSVKGTASLDPEVTRDVG